MNCKQGDIAYITAEPYVGHLVSVLHATPVGRHTLPDGFPGYTNNPTCWVCESLGSAFNCPVSGLGNRKTMYAAIQDKYLRPIRPSEGQDETLSWKDVPQGEIA